MVNDKMKKVFQSLKIQLKPPAQNTKIIWYQYVPSLEDDIEDLQNVAEALAKNSFQFGSEEGCNVQSQFLVPEEAPKKRGRPRATETRARSDRSDSTDSVVSLNESVSSRGRRAAAQAAEQKLAQVQSLCQLNTKLRRPTDFDEKQNRAGSSPPAKCRRTRRNQSAGSCSPKSEHVHGKVKEENNYDKVLVDNGMLSNNCLNECSVAMNKLDTPTIKSYAGRRSTKSLDRLGKRSEDLFNECTPPVQTNTKYIVKEAPSLDPIHKTNKNQSTSKKDLDSGISSTEEELQQLVKINIPVAHSSPFLHESFEGEFNGFREQPESDKVDKPTTRVRENTFIVSGSKKIISSRHEKTDVLLKETLRSEGKGNSREEIEIETETNIITSKTRILRKRGSEATVNVEEKENINQNNEANTASNKVDDSPNLRSRTKVLKKAIDPIVVIEKNDKINGLKDELSSDNTSPELNIRSRTKTIRKHNEQQDQSENEASERNIRSRTKTIRKHTEKEQMLDSSEEEPSNLRSRTKTIKKETNPEASEFGEGVLMTKNKIIVPASPAQAKGELVKKRIEDFEKMQNGTEEVEEVVTVGRVTRNAKRNKVVAPAREPQSSKQNRGMVQLPASSIKNSIGKSIDKETRKKMKEEKENIPVSKLQGSAAKQPSSVERVLLTPLGVNNRVTPASEANLISQANKWTNSANRPARGEDNTLAFVQKQVADESGRKRKEDDRLKRQAKEDDAKKKKEITLKATAEEARRKREEKLQKVAAAREAAEKEKERLAAKAEKEREEKMRQIAAEKEKQKEEQLKKKQIMQQKTLEHEERRRQEEAARLAKLKEQEEEHKRLIAMKEREQEMKKQQKAELRLAEAEKAKHQGGKLGKLAVVNNAKLKLQQAMTPIEKTNGAQASKSYEITPAREDRPPLPPKTENDYGIDDANSEDSSDEESRPKKMIPSWAQPKNRERLLFVNKWLPKKIWDLFMECDPCPDINQMFAGNVIKKRTRTSSAVWRTPPKYSRVAS